MDCFSEKVELGLVLGQPIHSENDVEMVYWEDYKVGVLLYLDGIVFELLG